MAIKVKRNTFPNDHTASDFECFGPPAKKDGEFGGTKLADLGCFVQGDVDSNKYYHGAVVRSKKNSKWYDYFEYGRVGQGSPSFNFLECSSEQEAQREYEKQLHVKNDKRGVWENHTTLGRILKPKDGDDCYLVRQQIKRSTGLPDAKRITEVTTVHTSSSSTLDAESSQLLSDLNARTDAFVKAEMSSNDVPTLAAIDEARIICNEATTRINKVGLDLKDLELESLTNLLYSRIPKKKNRSKDRANWMLTPENIASWLQDLDAFEAAAKANTGGVILDCGIDIKCITGTPIGKFIMDFFHQSTQNIHPGLKRVAIKNVWEIARDTTAFKTYQEKVVGGDGLLPLHQIPRKDLDKSVESVYDKSHTFLLLHGTRTVNVSGILRESIRLPKELSKVAINGAMFGSGAYFADDYQKSRGYTSDNNSYWARGSGGLANRGAFIFICDVVLGKKFVPSGRQSFQGAPTGYDSIFAQMSKSGVFNNEFIVFQKDGIYTRYLVEF